MTNYGLWAKSDQHAKNDFTILKQPRNNSISVINIDKDESKSFSINKINVEQHHKYTNLNKSGNKTKNNNKILNYKGQIYSLSIKNNGIIIPKFIQMEHHKNIINNSSSQNI